MKINKALLWVIICFGQLAAQPETKKIEDNKAKLERYYQSLTDDQCALVLERLEELVTWPEREKKIRKSQLEDYLTKTKEDYAKIRGRAIPLGIAACISGALCWAALPSAGTTFISESRFVAFMTFFIAGLLNSAFFIGSGLGQIILEERLRNPRPTACGPSTDRDNFVIDIGLIGSGIFDTIYENVPRLYSDIK